MSAYREIRGSLDIFRRAVAGWAPIFIHVYSKLHRLFFHIEIRDQPLDYLCLCVLRITCPTVSLLTEWVVIGLHSWAQSPWLQCFQNPTGGERLGNMEPVNKGPQSYTGRDDLTDCTPLLSVLRSLMSHRSHICTTISFKWSKPRFVLITWPITDVLLSSAAIILF